MTPFTPRHPPRKWPEWWPDELRTPPDNAVFPRVETPFHSRSVGSYGPQVYAHALQYGLRLRWWQYYAHCRILEHDEDGELVWSEAGISTARQVGKGVGGIRPLCEWRIDNAELFGEPQTVLHLSHQVNTTIEIAAPAMRRARLLGEGHKVRLTNGEQEIRRPDGSRWLMRASGGAYGFSVNMPVVDEVWNIKPHVLDSMVLPTMTERLNPQLVLFSTANANATPTYQTFRDAAGEDDDRLLVEWSAPDEAWDNPQDRRYWRLAAPHWSEARERAMERAIKKAKVHADFAANWLNVWPPETVLARDLAMPAWERYGVDGLSDPGVGGIVVVDESRDASRIGMLVLIRDFVSYTEHDSVRDVVARASRADHLVIGMTMTDQLMKAGLTITPNAKYGRKEANRFTPLLTHTVRAGRLQHDRSPLLVEQAGGTIVVETESGRIMSARRSDTSTLGPKLLSWALGYERNLANSRPAIW